AARSRGGARRRDRGEADRDHWTAVFKPGGTLTPMAPEHPAPPEPPDRVLVSLLTPLRIRRGGHLVGVSQFDFHAFLGGLLRRISLLTYFFGDERLETGFAGLLRRAATVSTANRELRWHAWTRYSSRQQAALRMDGIVGRFELEGAGLDEFWPYLWLGQWTHAGKGTSMGLGRYVLEPAGARNPPAAEAQAWQGPRHLCP
ncbi:MAG: CRISPR system precrRNA processing endoribonuclease RAMP protein Cas6, partial [Rhodospirillales bacterium]|nr:CRISPR system precrRNA processing endoribonuclease RAMP protein Cas6 [Rhodospirillales bacterium]